MTLQAACRDEFLDAVKRGDEPAVIELLNKDSELVNVVDEYHKTALHWAAEKDHEEIAHLLLDAGANIEALTSWESTPLDWAATLGSAKVAELLLGRGARGFTILVAAALGKLADVKVMMTEDLSTHRRRAAPDSPDHYWPADSAHTQGDIISDAMYAAARNGHTEVVEYLLDHGAKVDAKGFFGATALHWAAINGHRETVELLMARGASRDIRDQQFDGTPEGWALEGDHQELAALLKE